MPAHSLQSHAFLSQTASENVLSTSLPPSLSVSLRHLAAAGGERGLRLTRRQCQCHPYKERTVGAKSRLFFALLLNIHHNRYLKERTALINGLRSLNKRSMRIYTVISCSGCRTTARQAARLGLRARHDYSRPRRPSSPRRLTRQSCRPVVSCSCLYERDIPD